ncbi:class F sortase [Streptomyces sp. NP160]|uniref:class F sortase n=1 Tax=Streptomyces sp. NP160 TaxID=2586637 RepID=UPI0015D5B6A3|nr:class F sortase [Streptomyces sp. NP160]
MSTGPDRAGPDRGGRAGRALTAVAVSGLVLAATAPAAWLLTGASSQAAPLAGALPAPAVSTTTTSAGAPAAAPSSSSSSSPSAPPAAPAEDTGPALPRLVPSDPAPAVVAAAAAPVRVQLPALGVDAPVDAVGAAPDGSVVVPEDGARTGWWAPGAAPGDADGSVVLVGHVDTPAGPGALFRLREAQAGQDVLVTDAAGVQHVYRTSGTAQFSKSELPAAALFTTAGAPRLVLISCGGEFDRASRHYADNVVVVADRVS